MTKCNVRCFKHELMDTAATAQLNFRYGVSSPSHAPNLSLVVFLPSAFVGIAHLAGYLHALKTLIVDCLILPRANPESLSSPSVNFATTPAMSGECSVHYTRFPCRVLLSLASMGLSRWGRSACLHKTSGTTRGCIRWLECEVQCPTRPWQSPLHSRYSF
jgi:hypothetical protein